MTVKIIWPNLLHQQIRKQIQTDRATWLGSHSSSVEVLKLSAFFSVIKSITHCFLH